MSPDEQAALLIEVFDLIAAQGGRLPREAFFKRLQTWPTPFREFVHVRRNGDSYEVLLQPRAADDPHFAGMWATTGITLPMRATHQDVMKLHGERETGLVRDHTGHPEAKFCGCISLPWLEREHGEAPVFGYLWTAGTPSVNGEVQWVPVDKLGSLPLIPHSRRIVDMALAVLLKGRPPRFVEHLAAL